MKNANLEFHNFTSYEEFCYFVNNLPEHTMNLYVFFKGRGGCIYCQMAESLVRSYLNDLKTQLKLAYVDVGDRDYWKDPACPFRIDARTRLMVIPTLIKWKGVQRLEGSQCNKRELLEMMFEDED